MLQVQHRIGGRGHRCPAGRRRRHYFLSLHPAKVTSVHSLLWRIARGIEKESFTEISECLDI